MHLCKQGGLERETKELFSSRTVLTLSDFLASKANSYFEHLSRKGKMTSQLRITAGRVNFMTGNEEI